MTNVSTKKPVASWLKIAATGGILLGAAAIVGSGAFAVFTSSATADSSLASGGVSIDLSDSSLTTAGMAPGDTVQQLLPIHFSSIAHNGDLVSAIKFSVSASDDKVGENFSPANTAGYNDGTGSSLFTGAVAADATTNYDGSSFAAVRAGSSALTYSISTCPTAWTKATVTSLYACSVTPTTTVVGGEALNSIQAENPLTLTPTAFGVTGNPATFPSNGDAVDLHSLISITLPATANNSFQWASVKLTFHASVVQRAGVTTAP